MEKKVEIKKLTQSDKLGSKNVDDKNTEKGKPKSEAAISGQVAAYTLLFLFIFVALLVWISGWIMKLGHTNECHKLQIQKFGQILL